MRSLEQKIRFMKYRLDKRNGVVETLVCDPICSRNQSTDVAFEMLEECAEETASVGESEVLACS